MRKSDVFREEVNKRFNQIDERFDLSFKHFSNIEDDLADIKSELNKIDKKKLMILEVRVERLERKLEKQMEKTKRN